MQYRGPRRPGAAPCSYARLPNCPDLVMNRMFLEHVQRQAEEDIDARHDLAEDLVEHRALFLVGTDGGRRVLEAPVCRDGMARPERAGFIGRVVAYGDDEIHLRRIRRAKLVPALAAQVAERVAGRPD